VLAGMLTTVFYTGWFGMDGLNDLFMNGMTGMGVPAKLASLIYAIIYTLIIYIPVYILYQRRIFIKV